MSFWDKNLSVIEEKHPHLLPLTPISSNSLFYLKESKFGQNIPGVIENKKNILLGSIYRKDMDLEEAEGHRLPLFLGIMNLLHQKESVQKMDKMILVEPNRNLFLFLMEHFDLVFILNHAEIHIFLGSSPEVLLNYLERDFSPYLNGILQLNKHDTSCRVFQTLYMPILTLVKSHINRWQTEWNTQKHFARNWFRNILHNFQNWDSLDKPVVKKKVILLAAGPSVEKMMDSTNLKRKDQSIIVVDTLLPLARELNIPVDFVVSLDCQIISYHHYLKGLSAETLAMMDIAVHPSLPRKASKVYFTGNNHPLVQYLCPDIAVLNTGLGNVTAFAVDAVLQLGAEEIELFGADFSFPRGKAYSRNTYLLNHFEYSANRFSPLENALYSFSSRSVLPLDESHRTTARLQFYKSQFIEFLDGKKDIHYENSNGSWKINRQVNNGEIKGTPSFSVTRIKGYRKVLESINWERLVNANRILSLAVKERDCIVTLFPLMTLYLEKMTWQKGLTKAKDWAVDQLLALEAMEA